ncbi:Microcystin-dependent protein [Andreprevotia lacus DSM 23236]|jgi:microcystin-dependent protein|uniref:Microcystin-dependent protein n=1 Tax=Andreprevotia lacus DSM 23236 TaxID=1121001 RepID=A0A1W1Y0H3_9NEIS|nr:tail fiber protein [Andreprevotia lacus]SMC29656.1 Microcystin-dependent protein [Andreprevotia lacus DSM 23236]
MATPFVGEIRIFAGTFAPVGWALCNGQQLSISENEVLYSLIGTTYGGDGQIYFLAPNLNGRLPIGQGQGLGLSQRVVGQSFGSENVTLTTSNLPTHTHTVQASKDAATTATPGNTGMLATTGSNFYHAGTPPSPTAVKLSPGTLSTTGNTLPHSNMMPTLSLNYIIATAGIYPSQS